MKTRSLSAGRAVQPVQIVEKNACTLFLLKGTSFDGFYGGDILYREIANI